MAETPGGTGGFLLRPLRKPEELRQAEEVQQETLAGGGEPVVPASQLKLVQDNGGLVLGAFVDIYLAGLVVASIGWDGAALYLYLTTAAVRPAYRHHGVGRRLLGFLRDEVERLGLAEVRWAFDPLERAAASLSVRRLGARPDRFLANYFGQLGSPADGASESDRLHVHWPLADPEVVRRLGGQLPTSEDDLRRLGGAIPTVETEVADSGLRVPTAVAEIDRPEGHLEVPFDFRAIRAHEPRAVGRWRHAVRDAFRAAFDGGYVVDDFVSATLEHERRCFYLLRSAPSEPAPPPPA